MSGGRPYYGYPTWHVLSNIVFGSIALAASVIGFFAVSPLMLALMPAAAYFFWNAYLWARGGFLEERLRIREEFMRIVKPADGELVLDVGTGGGIARDRLREGHEEWEGCRNRSLDPGHGRNLHGDRPQERRARRGLG